MKTPFARLIVSVASLMVCGALAAQVMDMSRANTPTVSEAFHHGHPGIPQAVTRIIFIRALDIRFKPNHVTVNRGETVRFVVTDDGKLDHEFVIGNATLQAVHEKEMQAMAGQSMHDDDANAISLRPGQTKSLVWTFTKTGVTEYACHMPGHFAAGMVGTIAILRRKLGRG